MIQWEYYKMHIANSSEAALDNLGKKGWELVTSCEGVLFFKRQKTEKASS